MRTPAAPLAFAMLLCGFTGAAHAQCPDGAPPPCRSTTVASLHRVNPPLNPKAWIVVPFGNVTRSPDLDWLRDASVNLLSLDMSRWTDVSVIPDKRVGDLVRELPAARNTGTLTLADGILLAKRAGAGKLVMGDFLRQGKGARLIANVFDVKSGEKIRTVSHQAVDQDSLLTAFAPLARGVLAVPAPQGTKLGAIGTHSLDAYQEYLVGVTALNRYDLVNARTHLSRALALDTGFALAHLQYSLMLMANEASVKAKAESREHALAARRLGTTLPRRERTLIDAGVALASDEFTRACEVIQPLAAADSTDVEALFLLGECTYHDTTVDPSPTDTATGRFRSSWNTSLRAFTRILEIDPSYLGAIVHVIDMLSRPQRGASTCPPGAGPATECVRWYSMVLRSADTLETVPTHGRSGRAWNAQVRRGAVEKAHLISLQSAQRIAQRWLDADTTSEAARLAVAQIALSNGDLETADRQLLRLSTRATSENVDVLRARMDVATKRGRGAEARRMLDSIIKVRPDEPDILVLRGSIELTFGRLARLDRGLVAASTPYGPAAVAYARQVGRAMLGLAAEGMPADEAAYFSSPGDTSCATECRLGRISATITYSLHVPTGVLAIPGTLPRTGGYSRLPAALAAHDTVLVRQEAEGYERDARNYVTTGYYDFAFSMIAADAYLSLHDTTAALRMTRFFVDTAFALVPMIQRFVPGLATMTGGAFWPRMMLLRADLAAAGGEKNEARIWYARVLDLWAEADPELQPTVSRIRRSVVALGP